MKRSFQRKDLVSEKARRVSEVNTARINKRKYYGLQTEIDDMKESLEYHFTHTSVIENLRSSIAGVELRRAAEDIASDTVNSTDFLRDPPEDAEEDSKEEYALAALALPLRNSYEKGTRRAFNSNGDSLPPPEDVDKRVNSIVQDQKNYISKLDDDLRQKAEEVIREGVKAGLATSAIVENLREELKNMIDNRSSTIANSEVIAAGSAGAMATFEANGVDKVMWVSSQDEDVCSGENFRYTYNGTTYTNCRQLDGTEFSLPGNFPEPVLQSHPNCRCTLVSVED